MNSFKNGDAVMLAFRSTSGMPKDLADLNGQIYRVDKATCGGMAYELIGCISRAGVPWTLHEDWLVPMREDKR